MSDAPLHSFQAVLDSLAASDLTEPKAHLEALASRFPFVTGSTDRGFPRVMMFRSLRHAQVKDTSNGSVRLKIPEGHFSTRFFLQSMRAQRITANVFGDNLNQQTRCAVAEIGINTISCPDLHEEDLIALSQFLARFPELPIVNPPHRVMGTGRSDIAELLQDIKGLRVPRTVKLTLPDPSQVTSSEDFLKNLRLPLILRMTGTHTGRTVVRMRKRSDYTLALTHFPPNARVYATEFVDARCNEKLFVKYRAFFIDDRLYPVARLVSNSWNVHSGDRYRVMFALPEAQRLEQAYLADPEQHLGKRAIQALHEVYRRVRLDFFGIDFAMMPSGDVLVFEVNAVMRHNYDHAKTFHYTRQNLDRISAAFDEMVINRIKPRGSVKSCERPVS